MRDGRRTMSAATYPRREGGATLWACCVSTIGPACQHTAPIRDHIAAVRGAIVAPDTTNTEGGS